MKTGITTELKYLANEALKTSIQLNNTQIAQNILGYPIATRSYFNLRLNFKNVADLLAHKNTKLLTELVDRKVLLEYGENQKKFLMISDVIRCMFNESEKIFGPKQESAPGEYQSTVFTYIEELLLGVQDCMDDNRCCRLLLQNNLHP